MSAAPDNPPVPVLHLINGEHYAGAERVQDLLALRLPEYGYRVGFACLKPGQFPEARAARESPLYPVAMRSRFDLRPIWQVARIVRREGYRIVHTHTARTALIGRLAAALARVPLVHHVHSPTSRDTTKRWTNRINAAIERWGMGRARRVIAVSESLRRHVLEQGFDPARLVVVHNGVPGPESVPPRQPPGNQWTLGTVALFRPRKGMETLVDALALMKCQGLPVTLRAVGPFETPEYEIAIKRRAAEQGVADRVEWVGFAANVYTELARMDVFVLPSLFGEGLPMVVLEAMAAGVPVVATEVEGVSEAVLDGQDGLIVRPGDPHALAAAVARITRRDLDWSALRSHALARHAEFFSDRRMASGVAAVYRGLHPPIPDPLGLPLNSSQHSGGSLSFRPEGCAPVLLSAVDSGASADGC